MLGSQTPRLGYFPDSDQNSWREVVKLCATFDLHLDEWQQIVLRSILGEDVDGKWSSPQAGVCVPRQQGKGELIVALELAGLLLFGEKLIVHSAHEYKTAADGFRRIWAYFNNYDSLRKRVSRYGTATSREFIELKTGQALRFFARSKGSGRGFTADRLIMDEAQELSDDAWAAILPTISAVENPQVVLLGTAPSVAMNSDVFTRFRSNGLKQNGRQAWLEWSAEPNDDPGDAETWAKANPAFGLRGLTEAKISDEYESLDSDSFARERLGIWQGTTTPAVIDALTWADLGKYPNDQTEGRVAYAIDMSPDRSRASIGMAAWRPDGKRLIEWVETRESADWIVDVARRITEAQRPIGFVVDRGSPAGSYIQALQNARVPVISVGAREYADACGTLYDEAYGGLLAHLNQPTLNVALAAARKRKIGVEGAWAWHRVNATADITPIVACTLAIHGLSTKRRSTPEGKQRIVVLS